MTLDQLFPVSPTGQPAAPEGDAAGATTVGTPPPEVPAVSLHFPRHDREWAFAMYQAFARGGDAEQLRMLVIAGDPWSKSRARFARMKNGHVSTYQPADDRNAEAALRARLQSSRTPMFLGNVMVACRFYRSTFQRIDTDNLLKHVCDSATGVLWKDDSHVTLVLGDLQYDAEYPRTILLVADHESSLVRGVDQSIDCEHCGAGFIPPPGTRGKRRFCSAKCGRAAAGVDLTEPITCPQCGEPFRRCTSAQVYCSKPCARESAAGIPRGSHRRYSQCWECGSRLAHNRGGRCRTCWLAEPMKQFTAGQIELLITIEAVAT